MTAELFKYILTASFAATVLTTVLALLKPVTKKYFGYNWHYYTWIAVLAVMILPVRFEAPSRNISQTVSHDAAPLQAIVTNQETTSPSESEIEVFVPDVAKPGLSQKINLLYDYIDIFAFVWFLGMLAILVVTVIGYFRLLYRIRKKSAVIPCPEIRKHTSRNITVRVCKDLSSPFILGLIRPCLVLPDTALTAEQLDNILMHEITHLRRNDILCKWLVVFAKALHWFNPAVYYIARQINVECEISCDMSVVKNMNNAQTTDYINTIITLLSIDKTKSIPLTTGMTGNKNTLKKRFSMIKNKFFVNRKIMVISSVAAALMLAAAICVSGFLNGKWISNFNHSAIELNTDVRSGNTFNALIVGTDTRDRADSIMLLRLTNAEIEGFSIPRNTVFGGKTITQILTQENGDQNAVDAIRNELSVPISYYAKIKIDLIRDLVDAVGGLTVDVPIDMKYDDPQTDLHIDLKKGTSQKLNGDELCGLLRFRRSNDGTGYPQGDLDRIKIGHQVISAFISQNKLSDIAFNAKDIQESISKNVITNYSIKNLVKDSKLLSGKKLLFHIIPGNNIVKNGIFEYRIDIPSFRGILNPPVKLDNPPKPITATKENTETVPENTPLAPVSSYHSYTADTDVPITNTPLEKVEAPSTPGFEHTPKYSFSSIAEAEEYLKGNGITATNDKSFKAGSGYIKNNYSFSDGKNEMLSSIASNDRGEVSMYFIGNLDTLMNVRFKDSETKDEVNSAIILAGDERIYKFTGLDPTRHYDVELSDLTEGEWKIEGQYIIF